MKISEVIKGLQDIQNEHGDLDCYYAKDEEGNGYQKLYYEASLMFINKDDDVFSDESVEEMKQDAIDSEDEFDENKFVKICCVN